MGELSTLLDAADEREDPIIRDAARRAGLLWQCRCRTDNPTGQTCDGCGSRAEDVCVVGDPDPTPNRLDRDEVCGAKSGDIICTRRAGHTGQQHVSGDSRAVVAVWEWHHALHVQSSNGTASVLTVVVAERDVNPHSAGAGSCDRATVRGRVHTPGQCDVYAVFERQQHSSHWQQVTEEITASQLPRWTAYQQPHTAMRSCFQHPAFHGWLNGWLTWITEQNR